MSCRIVDSLMCFICIFLYKFPGFTPDSPTFWVEWNKAKSGFGSSGSTTKPKPHFIIYFRKGTHYIWCNVCTTINVITMTSETMTMIIVMFLRCSLQLTSLWRLHQHYMINTIIACCLNSNVHFVCVCVCLHLILCINVMGQ